jgi:glycosyltransferase involved in cell wall biosynthesis
MGLRIKMNILIASHTYWPHLNGQAVFTTNLAEGLAAVGHNVTVLVPSVAREQVEVHNKVTVQTTPTIDLRFIHRDLSITFAMIKQINNIFDRIKPDLVHLQDPEPVSQLVMRVAKKRNIPVVATHHPGTSIWAPYLPGENQIVKKLVVPVIWNFFLNYLNKVDQVSVPSKASAKMLISHGLKKPVRPISCGVRLSQFVEYKKADSNPVNNLLLDPKKLKFIYIGRLDEEKRVDVLIHAMKKVRNPDIRLLLAGGGSKEKNLRELVDSLNLQDRVIFLGNVSRLQVNDILHTCDVFIMPGDGESLSIATLEAMACGLPVIAADSMALPELVQNGKNGYLFQPGNANDLAEKIELMASMERNWPAMSAHSYKVVQNHQLNLTIERYERLYLQVIRQRKTQLTQKSPIAIPGFLMNQNILFFAAQAGVILVILLVTLFFQHRPVIASVDPKIDLISDDMLASIQRLIVILKKIDLPEYQANGSLGLLKIIKAYSG